MTGRLRRTLRKWSFPVLGWLSAGMYLLVAGGVPLSIPGTATKDLSVPFPCMDCPCGCQNAEQCWTSCCCHTPAERLAWAREHGITPPRALIVEVDAEAAAPQSATCCAHAEQRTCCSTKPSYCSSTSGSCHAPHPADPVQRQAGNDTILGIHALACHGFGTNWLAGFIALPPVAVDCEYRPLPIDGISMPVLQFLSPAFPPPVPPPRAIAARASFLTV